MFYIISSIIIALLILSEPLWQQTGKKSRPTHAGHAQVGQMGSYDASFNSFTILSADFILFQYGG